MKMAFMYLLDFDKELATYGSCSKRKGELGTDFSPIEYQDIYTERVRRSLALLLLGV